MEILFARNIKRNIGLTRADDEVLGLVLFACDFNGMGIDELGRAADEVEAEVLE